MRKHNVNEINLRIDSIEPFVMDECKGVVISWSSKIGFGQYTLRTVPAAWDPNETIWVGESECMDNMMDKEFGKKLMQLWIDQTIIIE